ncbi:MAG: DUF6285 domain-containing protein [Alphaproteobacteria bacterium]
MRNRPNAVELLDIAEKTLSGEVAPDMSNRQRYNVALIASAMGIARREMAGGISAWDGELDTLQALYGGDPLEPPETALSHLNRKLAADLRAGVYDEKGKAQKAALNLLCHDVLARMDEDNPRYEKTGNSKQRSGVSRFVKRK